MGKLDFDGTKFLDVARSLAKRDEFENNRAAIRRAYYATFWAAREQARRMTASFSGSLTEGISAR